MERNRVDEIRGDRSASAAAATGATHICSLSQGKDCTRFLKRKISQTENNDKVVANRDRSVAHR